MLKLLVLGSWSVRYIGDFSAMCLHAGDKHSYTGRCCDRLTDFRNTFGTIIWPSPLTLDADSRSLYSLHMCRRHFLPDLNFLTFCLCSILYHRVYIKSNFTCPFFNCIINCEFQEAFFQFYFYVLFFFPPFCPLVPSSLELFRVLFTLLSPSLSHYCFRAISSDESA